MSEELAAVVEVAVRRALGRIEAPNAGPPAGLTGRDLEAELRHACILLEAERARRMELEAEVAGLRAQVPGTGPRKRWRRSTAHADPPRSDAPLADPKETGSAAGPSPGDLEPA